MVARDIAHHHDFGEPALREAESVGCSVQTNTMSSPASVHETSRVPVAAQSAPYLSEFVASSCRTSARVVVVVSPTPMRGTATRTRPRNVWWASRERHGGVRFGAKRQKTRNREAPGLLLNAVNALTVWGHGDVRASPSNSIQVRVAPGIHHFITSSGQKINGLALGSSAAMVATGVGAGAGAAGFAAVFRTCFRLFGALRCVDAFAFFALCRFVIQGELPATRYVPLRRGRIAPGRGRPVRRPGIAS